LSTTEPAAGARLLDKSPPAVGIALEAGRGATGPPVGRRARRRRSAPTGRPLTTPGHYGPAIGLGIVVLYMSVIVLIPLSAVVWRSTDQGLGGFWHAINRPEASSTLKLTIGASLLVAFINLLMGTAIAWLLVRDKLPGRSFIDLLIDLPFALPTIVAGLALLTVYGTNSPVGLDIAYTRAAVVVALLFVTLPFVVRTVQPVLLELDREMEEAAASLGAHPGTIFRRIILPNIVPAMAAGTALAFARAMSEFGSTVLISGNLPFKTQVASVHIFNQLESDNITGAAAVSTVLLIVSLLVLVALDLLQRWAVRRG
jgi:sulfate/thiosulfate transport system permease protein